MDASAMVKQLVDDAMRGSAALANLTPLSTPEEVAAFERLFAMPEFRDARMAAWMVLTASPQAAAATVLAHPEAGKSLALVAVQIAAACASLTASLNAMREAGRAAERYVRLRPDGDALMRAAANAGAPKA